MVLLAYAAVDALAQQVGMPAVAGVLIDPVNPHLADGDALLARPCAEVREVGQHRIGRSLFAGEVGERVVDQRLLRNGTLEGGITFPVEPWFGGLPVRSSCAIRVPRGQGGGGGQAGTWSTGAPTGAPIAPG